MINISEVDIDDNEEDEEICECGDCGEEVYEDDYSCSNCGAILDWDNEGNEEEEGFLSGLFNWNNGNNYSNNYEVD